MFLMYQIPLSVMRHTILTFISITLTLIVLFIFIVVLPIYTSPNMVLFSHSFHPSPPTAPQTHTDSALMVITGFLFFSISISLFSGYSKYLLIFFNLFYFKTKQTSFDYSLSSRSFSLLHFFLTKIFFL